RLILGTTNVDSYSSVDISNPDKFKMNVSNNETASKTVFFPETLLDIIFAEVLINAKKCFPSNFADLYFELNSTEENCFEVSILNNFKIELPYKKLLLINKNNVKYNTNGLGLIKRITGLLSDKYAEIKQGNSNKYNKKLFQVSITIKNLQNG